MNITSQNVCTEKSSLSNTVIHLWDLKSNDSSYIWKDFKDMESQSLIFNKCFKDELIDLVSLLPAGQASRCLCILLTVTRR